MAPAARESVDRQHAVVGAAAAADTFGSISEGLDLPQRQHGCLRAGIVPSGQQRRAKGPHDSGDIRAGNLHLRNFFKGPQHRLIMECPPLHHDMPSQILCICQLYHLEQGVFNDRIGQPRRDIRNIGPFLLRLLHIGIHEYRAACSQIDGIFRKQRRLCKILRRIPQGIGKTLYKGAASRRARLIEHDVVDGAILQLNTFHILPADIQHTVHLRIKESRRRTVGNRLYFSFVAAKGRFQQGLAISRGTGSDNFRGGRQNFFQFSHGGFCRLDRIPLVIGIKGIQELSFAADQRHFCCGRPRIDPEETVPGIAGQLSFGDNRLFMPLPEGLIFFFVRKQSRQTRHFKRHLHTLFQPCNELVQGRGLCIFAFKGRAHSRKQMRSFGVYRRFGSETQGADKSLFQLREKVQRAAQKCDAAANRLPTSQPGNGLVDNSLKYRGCQIGFCRPFVEQRLNIRFRKHPTAGRNGINLLILLRRLIQAGSIRLQKRRHLIDKRAGPSRADAVHPLFQAAGKIDNLCVLAAQLDGYIRLGRRLFQCFGNRHNLLDKFNAQSLSKIDGTGASDFHAQFAFSHTPPHFPQKLRQRFLGARLMSLISSVNYGIVFAKQNQLDGGRADINTGTITSHYLPPGALLIK